MALRDQPYLPLYIQDFITDERLRECSAESVGVYIMTMCVLHKSTEYGVILLGQKDKQNQDQIISFASKLAKHLPFGTDVISRSITELVEAGVLTIEGDKLMQLRMVHDNAISIKRSRAGKIGGEKTKIAKIFAKAKPQANTENENEIENETKNPQPLTIGGENLKKKIIEFYQYRSEKKNPILPSQQGRFLNKLSDLSKNNDQDAIKILENSMANGWTGIFDLKQNQSTSTGAPTITVAPPSFKPPKTA